MKIYTGGCALHQVVKGPGHVSYTGPVSHSREEYRLHELSALAAARSRSITCLRQYGLRFGKDARCILAAKHTQGLSDLYISSESQSQLYHKRYHEHSNLSNLFLSARNVLLRQRMPTRTKKKRSALLCGEYPMQCVVLKSYSLAYTVNNLKGQALVW